MSIFWIILGLLPSFTWLFFYLQEDLHPEPKRLLVKTFILGALFAFFALFFELFFECGVAHQFQNCREGSREPATSIPLFLLAFALIEEIFKFSAAYVAVHKSASFNEPVDAMIYAVVAAMGFATVENLGALNMDGQTQSGLLNNALEITSLRFIGATLLHSLASAIAGYYWAVSIRDFNQKRFIFLGIATATVLHAIFNHLIIRYESMTYPVVLVVIVGFFVLNDFEKLKRKNI